MTQTFLSEPQATPELESMYAGDVGDLGFVMNLSRVWGHAPQLKQALVHLVDEAVAVGGLTVRQRGVLITALASTLGDSYCSIAWGRRLAGEADPETAAGVLRGDDSGVTAAEQALAAWARQVAGDPNSTRLDDVQRLRDAGFDDRQILAITVFVAVRLAFSTVNDALGAAPDAGFRQLAPEEVLSAVDFGRPISE